MNNEMVQNLIEKAEKDGVKRMAVTGIVFHVEKCLLLQRKENDFLGGYFEAPGGQVEEKETLLDALKREITEETNFTVENVINYISSFDYLSSKGFKTRNFNFIVSVTRIDNIVISEHQGYVWATKQEISHYKMTKEMLESIMEAWEVKDSQ